MAKLQSLGAKFASSNSKNNISNCSFMRWKHIKFVGAIFAFAGAQYKFTNVVVYFCVFKKHALGICVFTPANAILALAKWNSEL